MAGNPFGKTNTCFKSALDRSSRYSSNIEGDEKRAYASPPIIVGSSLKATTSSIDKSEYGAKKKAYYAFGIMTQILEGSDWTNITEIDLGFEKSYCYKFDETDRNIYVIWQD